MKGRIGILSLCLAGFFPLLLEAQPKLAVQKLAEGVWAASSEKSANIGWFLLGDGVLVVDASSDAATAKEVLRQVAETAKKPVRYVALTHAHGDHIGGARTFAEAGAQIICQENTAPSVLSVLNPAGIPPGTAARIGVLTVAERLMFVGGSRRAEIYWLGSAHTRGDLVVLLPQEKILFSGDLATNGRLPYLGSGDVDPKGWEGVLARLAAAPVERMVPGHGEIGPRSGIGDTLAYLRRVNELGLTFVQNRIPEEFVHIELRKPENRIENVNVTDDHVANVKAVMKIETEKTEKPTPSPAPTPRRTPARERG